MARSSLLDKRLVFITGKGGVGKSTVALALALAAAERGQRTILCEVGAQEHLSQVFHSGQVGFHEVEMRENLWTISIDPDESMREYVLLQLKVKPMRDLLFRSRIFNYLAAATPGLKELVTIGKIWELTLDERKARGGHRYDLVVVDAPATGHGVGFLQTPRTFANVARVGPIAGQAQALDAFITDHREMKAVLSILKPQMLLKRNRRTLHGRGVAHTDTIKPSFDMRARGRARDTVPSYEQFEILIEHFPVL